MRMVREGTSILELKGSSPRRDLSPFELVTIPPPADLPPYGPPNESVPSHETLAPAQEAAAQA